MRIIKEECLGLIIDIQERLHPHIYENEELELNTSKLIRGLNSLEVPIFVTQQYTKALGETIAGIQTSFSAVRRFEKIHFSCFAEPDFKAALLETGRKTIIIAGEESHICVLQTAIDLKTAGFQVVIVSDCISSRTLNNKAIALKRMENEGVILTTYEAILFELCQKAGTETFKIISKLVK